jgi:hypothetical protein
MADVEGPLSLELMSQNSIAFLETDPSPAHASRASIVQRTSSSSWVAARTQLRAALMARPGRGLVTAIAGADATAAIGAPSVGQWSSEFGAHAQARGTPGVLNQYCCYCCYCCSGVGALPRALSRR